MSDREPLVTTMVGIHTDHRGDHEIEFTGPADDPARICKAAAAAFQREHPDWPVLSASISVDVGEPGEPQVMGRTWLVAEGRWYDDTPENFPAAQ